MLRSITLFFRTALLLTVGGLCTGRAAAQFGGNVCEQATLMGQVYRLPANTSALPDFSILTPVDTVYTETIDVSPRSFSSGFPGVPDLFEWFAVVYTGTFRVEPAGTYTFRLLSDDGSKLFIDEQLVVDNDGLHSPRSRSGSVFLDASRYGLELPYYQGPRTEIALQLFYQLDDGPEQLFPGTAFALENPEACDPEPPAGPITVRPNPFTPNGDGIHDRVMFDLSEATLTAPRVDILSFSGRRLKTLAELEGAALYWDGRDLNGQVQPPAVYLYILQDGGVHLKTGAIVLAR